MPPPPPLPLSVITPLIQKAFSEDFGEVGDLTTGATIAPSQIGTARLSAREKGIACGTEIAAHVFQLLDPEVTILRQVSDGTPVSAGDTVLELCGKATSLLSAERTALNFLGHMMGIASLTAAYVEAVAHTPARIASTRKTLPGLRAIQKYAVQCGGGLAHRYGLHDAVMIKDNHIIAAGGIGHALKAIRARVSHTVKIEIEVDTLAQLEEVLAAGDADIVLLDNMSQASLREAVALVKGQLLLEASGNVSLETVGAIAETGVDVISSGRLTHSAPNLDIGMELSTG
ncbi:nicotinate-nucleotide pyrophosphorylase [Parvularcula bermudensis HTCC2503]|uniref:Probable nicotinate-nucleotide pyrophosphorylase [carboxylating] n=1 Tax=Parvularcula bermudensis (strain ATCC BAA-594 / HTCC2503 / KCTC 12087) TaxID=314260 RepID=E0TCK2_PARBH|nr:carboxylating nicotinate-nucleotide diphosphorylase [Parvularcula bermudensis]ADM08591.1 nicotinate-nucleotide pyrophosphorylase [Parvularcula bermudensis HTCC2503]